ncbi:RNA pseudouridylate synthase [Nitzschia inconspicua]|uniref:RNA pseudouridylate synthase n=1 Tax=Nitzschia inconspicua TaxID=303405 RepID=A0A9K3LIR5_9STRA|nr:RNA pseudouridylate synthase [Nitzschia inconspicua]
MRVKLKEKAALIMVLGSRLCSLSSSILLPTTHKFVRTSRRISTLLQYEARGVSLQQKGRVLLRHFAITSDDDVVTSIAEQGHTLWEEQQPPQQQQYSPKEASFASSSLDLSQPSSLPSSESLVPGSNEGFYVVKTYQTDLNGFDWKTLQQLEEKDLERLEITTQNISVPLALMIVDPEEYPSKSKARKACRKANIMIHRGPLQKDELGNQAVFDASKCQRARVGDRVFPGDVLAKQIRIGDGLFPVLSHKKPPFELPVVFEDDHFAIVNKPAGVVVHAQRKAGHGLMTIRAALPFAVRPPTPGTLSTLRRPQPVHRLDKPTSGLLLIAKTKPAMVHLSHQFRDRKIKKTYVALVNGIPQEPTDKAITANQAQELGVDVNGENNESWQLIDHPLDGKHAMTVWRALNYTKSLKANDKYMTLVELKPKTGRYHQLRRHMAWVCDSPIVGDSEYDGGGSAMHLRERGLFLCSNRVTLEHPYYNDLDNDATVVYHQLSSQERKHLWLSPDNNKIMVTATIDIPEKFSTFMQHEAERYRKLAET